MKILPVEFEIPFYKFNCNSWTFKKEKLKQLIYRYQQYFYSDICSSVYTTFLKDNVNLKQEICNIIDEELNTFKILSNLEIQGITAWFQISNFMDNHTAHDHGSGYSCVLFINFLKGIHQPTHFISPFTDSIYSHHKIFVPDVDEGDIIFFPSSILHYAPSNKSQTPRVIASMNLEVTTK